MTTVLYHYPVSAAFGRIVPKNKILEHCRPSRLIKDLFIRQVKQIVWAYKLAPETINLPETKDVPEIQVFNISLKEDKIRYEVLNCIDQTIPFPIIFELHFEEKTKAIAAYKRPSKFDSTKWVVSDYFETDWLPSCTMRSSIPVVHNLEELYKHLLNPLMPYPINASKSIQTNIERLELILARHKDVQACGARLHKEKQFNRKVAINAELRVLRQELESLTRSLARDTQKGISNEKN